MYVIHTVQGCVCRCYMGGEIGSLVVHAHTAGDLVQRSTRGGGVSALQNNSAAKAANAQESVFTIHLKRTS